MERSRWEERHRDGDPERTAERPVTPHGDALRLAAAIGNRGMCNLVQRRPARAFEALPPRALIQRTPAVAYAALNKRMPGMAIPLKAGKWKRPKWLRGHAQGAATMRAEVLARTNPALLIDGQPFYRCPICNIVSHSNGMSVEHAIDWTVYCAGSADLQELEERYHDLDNLYAAHGNCNSTKGTKDLFDWWRGATATNYVNDAEKLKTIKWAIEQTYQATGVDWLFEIDVAKRLQIVDQIANVAAQKASQNVFGHMMAASSFQSAIGGWQQMQGGGGSDSEEKMDYES